MFELLLYGAGLVGSLAMLIRLGLMVTGKFKDPMLAQFERYGGDESTFNLIPGIMLWGGLSLIFAHITLEPVILLPSGMVFFGALMLLLHGMYYTLGTPIKRKLDALSPRPRWYKRLMEYTAREERRQLAYMWLRLPRRTRLIFNVNDRAFYQWADLIVMSTTF